MRMRVVALTATPVKGLHIAACSHLELQPGGVLGDRRFYVIDASDRMVNGKVLGALNAVEAVLEEAGRHLRLAFPDGGTVSAPIALGGAVRTRFHSGARAARVLEGPFGAALSEYAGQALRVVAPVEGSAVDRGARGAVSLISRASLASLAAGAGEGEIDSRRFRMSIEVDGTEAYEEDGWIGRELEVGRARVLLHGHVGRCLVTSRDPDSGEIDLPTLDHLRTQRAGAATTEPLAFGVYGSVTRPGLVSVGDAIALLAQDR